MIILINLENKFISLLLLLIFQYKYTNLICLLEKITQYDNNCSNKYNLLIDRACNILF